MYIITSRLFKRLKLMIDIWKMEFSLKIMFWWSLNDATLDINNVLSHWMIQQINMNNVFSNLIEGCCKIK